MKKVFSKNVITTFIIILSICMSIVPLTAFTVFAEDSPSDICCELSSASDNTLKSELSESQVGNEILTVKSSAEEIIASIKSDSKFTINGTVEKGGKRIDANEYYDFSLGSKFDIAEWAYKNNYISEAEKIDCYCDLYMSNNFNNIYCLSGVIDEISEYRDNNVVTAEIGAKIDAVFARPFTDEVTAEEKNETRSAPDLSNEANYSSSNFRVYYDKSQVTQSTAQSVANYFEQMRTTFINAGYEKPKLEVLKTRYQIYLDPNPKTGDATVSGTCFKNTSLTNTCSSYIVLYNFGSTQTVNQNMKEIICHEYFHAIQHAYNKNFNWFSEASSNWAVINYVGTSNTVNGTVNDFLGASSYLSNLDYKYGSVLYPLAIQRTYGGVNTIRRIFESYNEYSASLSDTQFQTMITEGIQNAGFSGTFISAYRYMTAYNCKPSYWYSNVYSGASAWNDGKYTYFPISTGVVGARSGALNSIQSTCYEFQIPITFSGRITINATFGGVSGNLQVYRVSETGDQSIIICTPTSTDQTIYVLENCENYERIRIVLSNTGTNSTNYYVTVTPTQT